MEANVCTGVSVGHRKEGDCVFPAEGRKQTKVQKHTMVWTCSLFSATTIVMWKVGDRGRCACLKELRPLCISHQWFWLPRGGWRWVRVEAEKKASVVPVMGTTSRSQVLLTEDPTESPGSLLSSLAPLLQPPAVPS